ncbi:MAG TPA: hypothetical protein VGL59_15630 [Polyangia bacterium]|jgi:hypothetical protein
MQKILVGCVALVAASWLTVGCSSSGSSNNGSGGSSAGSSGGSSGNNSGTGGTSGGSSGGTSGGSGSGGSTGGGGDMSGCVLPQTWIDNSPGVPCNTCMQMNCCDKIGACAANADCLKIYSCEQDCYSGKGPDGGVVAEDDAGTDDAGNTAMDNCVMACQAMGMTASASGYTLYSAQDSCVNGSLPPACGAMDVCY